MLDNILVHAAGLGGRWDERRCVSLPIPGLQVEHKEVASNNRVISPKVEPSGFSSMKSREIQALGRVSKA